jgi:hypothetical protein
MKIYKTDERFMDFCRFMFEENCAERWDHGMEPYKNAETYIEKNLNYLSDRYREQAKAEKPWHTSIYLK